MGKPPAGVKLTMEACCIMFSVKPEMEKNPDGAAPCPFELFRTASPAMCRDRHTTQAWARFPTTSRVPRRNSELGGKLIDKMKDYDKDNIPTKVRARGVL